MVNLTKRTYSIGKKSCELWIAEIPRENKESLLMVSGHGIAELLGYVKPADTIRKKVRSEWRRTWNELKGSPLRRPLETPVNWQPNPYFLSCL